MVVTNFYVLILIETYGQFSKSCIRDANRVGGVLLCRAGAKKTETMEVGPKITLEEGLDLRQVVTTGSVLRMNEVYDEESFEPESNTETIIVDMLGEPQSDFTLLDKKMTQVDPNGLIKKLILEEGGGVHLGEDCTVYVAYSAYWENEKEPFDVVSLKKPMEVDLKNNGLLPGLDMSIKTMLVGELSIFLLSHEVMYKELGIPPRIKPASPCVFYIKLLKSILTPKEGKLQLSEPNMFKRVFKEASMLYSSGVVMFKSMNMPLAISFFKRAVAMLHKCRLADEEEEKIQEKLLKKLYINLAITYNKSKLPLKACIACNELQRLNHLWNNGKALLQNAKALRMIGQYNSAEKRLRRAIKLNPNSKEMQTELELLISTRDSCNQNKLLCSKLLGSEDVVNNKFKEEVDSLIKNFKENPNLSKIVLPPGLNLDEMAYVREACIRENLFFNKVPKYYEVNSDSTESGGNNNQSFMMDKDQVSLCDGLSDVSLI